MELGRALLVIQHRRLEQRLQHVCAPAFFELRLEEERARVPPVPFATARLEVEGELGSQAVEHLLASALPEGDLISQSAAGQFQLLLLSAHPNLAAERLQRASDVLRERNLRISSTLHSSHDYASNGAASKPPATATETRLPVGGSFVVADENMRRVCKLLERIASAHAAASLPRAMAAGAPAAGRRPSRRRVAQHTACCSVNGRRFSSSDGCSPATKA